MLENRPWLLPLLWGEGWGEGEFAAQPSQFPKTDLRPTRTVTPLLGGPWEEEQGTSRPHPSHELALPSQGANQLLDARSPCILSRRDIREQSAFCPEGTSENSPAFQRRDQPADKPRPQGTAENQGPPRPSLRDLSLGTSEPGVETRGSDILARRRSLGLTWKVDEPGSPGEGTGLQEQSCGCRPGALTGRLTYSPRAQDVWAYFQRSLRDRTLTARRVQELICTRFRRNRPAN
jgi:hypothetical protein